MDAELFAVGGLSCGISALMVYLLRRPAQRLGLVDHPGGRKQHAGEVPLIGGVSIYIAVIVAIALSNGEYLAKHAGFISAASLLLVAGLVDDMRGMKATPKFVIQGLAVLLMVWLGDPMLTDLGNLFGWGNVYLAGLALPMTVFAVSGVINSINLSDGLDGLAGGFAFVALLAFLAVSIVAGSSASILLLTCIMMAVCGFLVFNLRVFESRPALIFMGDAGSMLLGFTLAWFSLQLTQGAAPVMKPVFALWFLALPLIETVSLMLRRIRRGQSPLQAGRDHLHYALLHAGFSHSQTVQLLLVVQSLLAGIGFAGWYLGAPESLMFAGFILFFLAYNHALRHSWKLMRWARHVHGDVSIRQE